MRISMDEPNLLPPNWVFAEIFLDGERIGQVIIADEEAGEIVRYQRDPDGQIISDGDQCARETLKGEVRIVLPGGP
jgi:YD repeat-containing protein